jgi:LysR family glycine cleavage system transcriptional activator
MCSPGLLADRPAGLGAAELMRRPLIHFRWARPDPANADWGLWLATARSVDPDLAAPPAAAGLGFSEEQHAIDAALAGQGIALCSDVVVGRELQSGALVKAHPLSLPGCGYYLVHLPDHPRQPVIGAFAAWLRSVA